MGFLDFILARDDGFDDESIDDDKFDDEGDPIVDSEEPSDNILMEELDPELVEGLEIPPEPDEEETGEGKLPDGYTLPEIPPT